MTDPCAWRTAVDTKFSLGDQLQLGDLAIDLGGDGGRDRRILDKQFFHDGILWLNVDANGFPHPIRRLAILATSARSRLFHRFRPGAPAAPRGVEIRPYIVTEGSFTPIRLCRYRLLLLECSDAARKDKGVLHTIKKGGPKASRVVFSLTCEPLEQHAGVGSAEAERV